MPKNRIAMNQCEAEIQAVVDRETDAWNRRDADALVELFHPDMIWPWPPDSRSHDPARWEFSQGRFDARVLDGCVAC